MMKSRSRHLNTSGQCGRCWFESDFVTICVSSLRDTEEDVQGTACGRTSPEPGLRTVSVLAPTRLHNRSQGPSETYLKSCSCANFRFNLRVQDWNTICLSIYPLAWLAFCQTDVCHMQVISQPLCSTSLHALCTHSDPSANALTEEEVFLSVCIFSTTILLQSIKVFSCPSTLLLRRQNKNKKIHHFPNNWMS